MIKDLTHKLTDSGNKLQKLKKGSEEKETEMKRKLESLIVQTKEREEEVRFLDGEVKKWRNRGNAKGGEGIAKERKEWQYKVEELESRLKEAEENLVMS